MARVWSGFESLGDDLPTDDWMGVRDAYLAGRDALAAEGGNAWEGSTRTGDNLQAKRPSDLVALGAASRPAAVRTQANPRSGTVSRAIGTAIKGSELGLAETAGLIEGGLDVGANVLRTADLGRRVFDPTDLAKFPKGTSALNEVLATEKAIAQYSVDRLMHPSRAVDDARNAIHRTFVGLDPTLSSSPNVAHSYHEAGRNQGRLAADGSLLLLGPEAELSISGAVPFEEGVTLFRGRGFTPAQAERLAQPYNGQGHHVAAYRFGLPDWITESPMFRLKPRNINRGDFYQLHFENDPKFFGARFSKDIGGSWRGKTDLKLQKNGLARQFWDGTPSSLKSVVGSGIVVNDATWNR